MQSHFFNKDIYCLHYNNLPLFSKNSTANTIFYIKKIKNHCQSKNDNQLEQLVGALSNSLNGHLWKEWTLCTNRLIRESLGVPEKPKEETKK